MHTEPAPTLTKYRFCKTACSKEKQSNETRRHLNLDNLLGNGSLTGPIAATYNDNNYK